MNLLQRLLGTERSSERYQAVELFSTWKTDSSKNATSFPEYVREGLNGTPIVAALIQSRIDVYAEIDFFWRDRESKERLPDTPGLRGLRHPWPGGHLADLLALTELDVQLAGNAYVQVSEDWEFERLRPDWVWVVGRENAPGIDSYVYKPDEKVQGYKKDAARYVDATEMAHLIDMPDPLTANLGRSWIRSCLRDINADQMASSFVNSYFENAATPNLIIKAPRELGVEQRKEMAAILNQRYTGTDNAFKTLVLENGAEAMVVGSDLAAVEYSATRAAGETRIAAAAGIAPIVAGLREGLQAGTYSNYGQAVRKTLDWKIRPRWAKTARHFETILDGPPNAELWYDDTHIAAVQQDALDDAEIKSRDAGTISSLITSGFDPLEVPAAVKVGDFTTLSHTGLFSVQLQPPMSETGMPDDEEEPAIVPLPKDRMALRHGKGDQKPHGNWAKGNKDKKHREPVTSPGKVDKKAGSNYASDVGIRVNEELTKREQQLHDRAKQLAQQRIEASGLPELNRIFTAIENRIDMYYMGDRDDAIEALLEGEEDIDAAVAVLYDDEINMFTASGRATGARDYQGFLREEIAVYLTSDRRIVEAPGDTMRDRLELALESGFDSHVYISKSPAQMADTYVHEMAHAWSSADYLESVQLYDLHPDGPTPSEAVFEEWQAAFGRNPDPAFAYGATNDSEAFAEAVSMYIFDRDALDAFAPNVAPIIEATVTEMEAAEAAGYNIETGEWE